MRCLGQEFVLGIVSRVRECLKPPFVPQRWSSLSTRSNGRSSRLEGVHPSDSARSRRRTSRRLSRDGRPNESIVSPAEPIVKVGPGAARGPARKAATTGQMLTTLERSAPNDAARIIQSGSSSGPRDVGFLSRDPGPGPRPWPSAKLSRRAGTLVVNPACDHPRTKVPSPPELTFSGVSTVSYLAVRSRRGPRHGRHDREVLAVVMSHRARGVTVIVVECSPGMPLGSQRFLRVHCGPMSKVVRGHGNQWRVDETWRTRRPMDGHSGEDAGGNRDVAANGMFGHCTLNAM